MNMNIFKIGEENEDRVYLGCELIDNFGNIITENIINNANEMLTSQMQRFYWKKNDKIKIQGEIKDSSIERTDGKVDLFLKLMQLEITIGENTSLAYNWEDIELKSILLTTKDCNFYNAGFYFSKILDLNEIFGELDESSLSEKNFYFKIEYAGHSWSSQAIEEQPENEEEAGKSLGGEYASYINSNRELEEKFNSFLVNITNEGTININFQVMSGVNEEEIDFYFYLYKNDKLLIQSGSIPYIIESEQAGILINQNFILGKNNEGRLIRDGGSLSNLFNELDNLILMTAVFSNNTLLTYEKIFLQRSSINMHLASYLSGGVRFGGISTSELGSPKFECEFPFYYKNLKFGFFPGDTYTIYGDWPGHMGAASKTAKFTFNLGQPIFSRYLECQGKICLVSIQGYILHFSGSDSDYSITNSNLISNLIIRDPKCGIIELILKFNDVDTKFEAASSGNPDIMPSTPLILFSHANNPLIFTFN